MYKSILLAVDGSDPSRRAAKEAARIAAAGPDSQVTILYVADRNLSENETSHGASAMELELSQRKKTLDAEQALEAREVYYRTKILNGRPGPVIIEFANEREFDLLILGSRGRNALKEKVLGSVSQKAANLVRCPVLIVK